MSELSERFTTTELTEWQAAETTRATTPETSTATATQTTGSATGWTTETSLGVLASSAAVLTALTTAARGTNGERPEGAANQTETDGSDSSEGSGAGTETDTTETDTDTQGGETDTEEDQEDTDAGMPTDQDTDTDEGTDAEISEETPDTDTDTHNPLQPVDPATNGNTDGEDVSTDSDDSDRPDSDSTEDSGETSTATAGTNTNTDDTDQQDSDQDNTNTAPAPPVDPNAETEVDSGTDQSGSSTAPDNRGTDPDEGGDNAGHEDADSMVPPPPVDQNNTAGSEQNESDGSENEPLTNGVDSTDTDGENSVAGPGPANSPGSVIINGTETEDQVLTATLNDADGLPDGVDIRYQWQRNIGADSAFENIDNATSKTYTLGDADVGREVRVEVRYTDGNSTDETLTSEATAAVRNINDSPSGSVSIDGQATENAELTANTDTLADDDGLGTLNYQWQSSIGANGAFDNIDNATGETYTLGDADVGREVRVQVSYTDGNNTAETVTSAPTTAVTNINDEPTGSVSIDGAAREDETLTANTDNIADADGLPTDATGYRYQWQSNTGANGAFEPIAGATSQSYTLGDADVGREVRVEVRYTDGNNTAESLTSDATTAVTNVNDEPTGSVAIGGTATEDETLTAETTALQDADGLPADAAGYRYQWQSNTGANGAFENIDNATSETYTLGDEDVGREVRVQVNYTDDGGMDESLTSAATAAVTNVNDEPTGSVAIEGTATEDETLTAETTALQDADGLPADAAGYRYQWQSNTGANGAFENIDNATGETYTLGDADVGRNIRVVVNYTDGRGTDESSTSDATTTVTNINDDPSGAVTIDGTEEEDQTLTANTTALQDADGLPTVADAFTYQWQRNTGANGAFEPIAGATSQSYTLGDADVGREVRVEVRYTDGNNTDETVTSTPTTAVSNINDSPSGSVTIDGTVREDETLTTNTDNLDDADGLGAFSYQWQRSNGSGGFENIENATGQTYILGDNDVGREVQVMVSYTDDGGMDESLTSAATAAVENVNDNPTGSVTITGTVEEDQTLTANTTALQDADGLPIAADAFTYQWQRNTGANDGFENIENATSKTYTLGDADVGREVRVQISYTDGNSTDETVSSDATVAVGNVNDLPTGSVTIDGTVRGDERLTADITALQDLDGLPADASGYNYQWQRSDGSGGFDEIPNATSNSYTLVNEDIGREVRIQVSYTDGNNTSENLNSMPTAEVGTANIAPTGGVRIDGTVRQDQELSADRTALQDADGLPDNAEGYRYQWQRTEADGTFADIGDATEQTYTVAAADVGQRLQVVVGYTDNNGADETLSAATVSPAASNANDPVIEDDANIVNGTEGDDTLLEGAAGSQRINGLGGDDFLLGRADADILDGGAGVDWAVYPSGFEIEIDLETGTATGGTAEGDVLISIENILGGTGDDRFTGNNKDNLLRGQTGNDTLDGGAGNDFLRGDPDDDSLIGGHGDDILNGGSGNDLFRFRPDNGSDRITDFGSGDDRLQFELGLFADLEAVRAAARDTDDGNLEITLSETETLTLLGASLAALTAETVTTLDEEGNDTTTPPADASSASDASAFELDALSIDEENLMRLADSEGIHLPAPVEPQAPPSAGEDSLSAGSANRALALADPLGPPPTLALFDADLEGYVGL